MSITRRAFVTGSFALLTLPLEANAQPERLKRIGVVMAYNENDLNGRLQVEAFRERLRNLGWIEGRNIQIELRYAADDPARVRALGVELLGRGSDLMVSNSNLGTTILQSEVHNIPLVFVSVSDPLGSGFVKDLARPGGNVTGFANFQPSMGGKWLEKLREIAPKVERVGARVASRTTQPGISEVGPGCGAFVQDQIARPGGTEQKRPRPRPCDIRRGTPRGPHRRAERGQLRKQRSQVSRLPDAIDYPRSIHLPFTQSRAD